MFRNKYARTVTLVYVFRHWSRLYMMLMRWQRGYLFFSRTVYDNIHELEYPPPHPIIFS